jgi:membrane-associated phospholipid phosphatase
MPEIVKKNSFFLIPQLLLLLVLLPVLIIGSKENIHLFLNQFHSFFFDVFFKFITYFGSGIVPVIAGVLFMLFSFRKSFLIASSGLFAGLLAQVFKRFVFPDRPRPSKVFFDSPNLYIVEGVDLHWTFSFPSGHSATIFALCFCLAFFAERRVFKLIFFTFAILVAYSRVYLSQHFLMDVYAGSIIGTLSGIIMAYSFSNIQVRWFDKSVIYSLFRHNKK